MYLWSEEFKDNQYPNGIVGDLVSILDSAPFMENLDVLPYKDHMCALVEETGGCLQGMISSRYNFLYDGGM